MATTYGAVRVLCEGCAWRGRRMLRDPLNPNTAGEVSGFGGCPTCGGRLARATRIEDRRSAKAKADLQVLAQGARP